ncbi:MAG: hypothetical protein WCK90_06160 [archaeon]
MKPAQISKKDYTVQIGYSPEAKEKKLMKFITRKSGDEFTISADELSSMLIGGVNSDVLEATFVDSERINVVEVGRQLQCVLDKDMKKGDKININYTHPLPLEFAIIEQVYGIAKINMGAPALSLTREYIEEVKKKLKPEQEKFLNIFYKSFKNLNLNEKNKVNPN